MSERVKSLEGRVQEAESTLLEERASYEKEMAEIKSSHEEEQRVCVCVAIANIKKKMQ